MWIEALKMMTAKHFECVCVYACVYSMRAIAYNYSNNMHINPHLKWMFSDKEEQKLQPLVVILNIK